MTAREAPAAEAWRGKVGKLNDQELDEFLAAGNIARLGCLDSSGWPYVVPTWYQWADGGFYIIPRARSAWAKFMAADGRVSLSIDSSDPPYIKVQSQGEAAVVEEPNVG
ncbi:MAG: pyridoxamine 5'-phosphate oxidase family protein, partial [Chloroflexia bacterium]|nr:pyridoxamine 5'-phosphate oxidase family protein [Chloroflexia bacterium]